VLVAEHNASGGERTVKFVFPEQQHRERPHCGAERSEIATARMMARLLGVVCG